MHTIVLHFNTGRYIFKFSQQSQIITLSLLPANVAWYVFSCICLCNALTVESLDLETSFLICKYIIRISRSSSYIKVIRSRSRSQFAGCLPSTERLYHYPFLPSRI